MPISELQRLRKEYEKAIAGYQREKRSMGPYATHEDNYIAMQENIDDDQAVVNEINAEIRRQADIRSARDAEFEQRHNRTFAPRQPSVPKPLDTALAAWFRNQRYDPAKHFEISWQQDGRRFVANWASAPLRLQVWMVVQEGTPGATQQDGQHLMPCNNFEEQKAARIAESQRPHPQSTPRRTGPRRAEG